MCIWPALVILWVLKLDDCAATTWAGPMPEPDPVRNGAVSGGATELGHAAQHR